eukprot:RCo050737
MPNHHAMGAVGCGLCILYNYIFSGFLIGPDSEISVLIDREMCSNPPTRCPSKGPPEDTACAAYHADEDTLSPLTERVSSSRIRLERVPGPSVPTLFGISTPFTPQKEVLCS